QWDRLLVKAARHAIYVGLIVVGIKDLQFVSGIAGTCGRQEQAAVASRLTGSSNVLRDLPLHMKLVIMECALGFNVAGTFGHGHHAISNGPLGWLGAVLRRNPFVKILPVE